MCMDLHFRKDEAATHGLTRRVHRHCAGCLSTIRPISVWYCRNLHTPCNVTTCCYAELLYTTLMLKHLLGVLE